MFHKGYSIHLHLHPNGQPLTSTALHFPRLKHIILFCYEYEAYFCKTSVDLPIPGSPPIRIIEPGTKPPPSTLLSSILGIGIRSSVSCEISDNLTGVEVNEEVGKRASLEDFALTFSSTYVFHSPQAGHLPNHFGDSFPQLLQKKTDFVFAISISFVS